MKNIFNKKYSNLDDVLREATRKEKDDLDSDTYAEKKTKEIIRMLKKDDFRDGRISVDVKCGNAAYSKINRIFYGEAGDKLEDRFNDPDVYVKRGTNKIEFILQTTDHFILKDNKGVEKQITPEEARKYSEELVDQVQKLIDDATEKEVNDAIEKGLLPKKYSKEAIKKQAESPEVLDHMFPYEFYSKIYDERKELLTKLKDDKKIEEVIPNFTKIKPVITDEGYMLEPEYGLRIMVNGEEVVSKAKEQFEKDYTKKNPNATKEKVDEEKEKIKAKDVTDNFVKQIGRVGEFSETRFEKDAEFIKDQAIRGAAFRASSIPVKMGSAAINAPIRDVKAGDKMIMNAMNQIIMALNKGTQIR